MNSKTTEIFYLVDEFCKEFYKAEEGHVLTQTTVKRTRNREFILSDSWFFDFKLHIVINDKGEFVLSLRSNSR
jgi:hypothetical protein